MGGFVSVQSTLHCLGKHIWKYMRDSFCFWESSRSSFDQALGKHLLLSQALPCYYRGQEYLWIWVMSHLELHFRASNKGSRHTEGRLLTIKSRTDTFTSLSFNMKIEKRSGDSMYVFWGFERTWTFSFHCSIPREMRCWLYYFISHKGWQRSKGNPFLSLLGIQLDIKFLCALSDVSFLLCPKGRKSAGKAFSDPQGKPWMKKRARVRAWISAVEKGSTAASVHKSFKLPGSACWQGCVSTLLSCHRDYSRSQGGSQLGD